MSALAITSALIALSGQCAPTVAPGTTLSFARAESGLDPLAIHSNADGRSYHPATKAEAIAIASSMIARGERPDLGFMQINAGNLAFLRLSITTLSSSARRSPRGLAYCTAAYDPCMDAGGEAQACLRTAASTYNTGSPTRGFTNGYVHLIAAAAEHVIPAIAVAASRRPPRPTRRQRYRLCRPLLPVCLPALMTGTCRLIKPRVPPPRTVGTPTIASPPPAGSMRQIRRLPPHRLVARQRMTQPRSARKGRSLTTLALPLALALVLASTNAAFAQIGGGGGSGIFSGLLSWLQSNVVSDLITLAIIFAGAMLMWMRINPALVLCICVGAWVMLNASTIQSFL